MNIKSFIYLDTYKMYSISSQIFEGLTEFILHSTSNSMDETTKQKGLFGSGRIMAEIVQQQEGQLEKKFLHDYSYSIFEKHLIDNKKVLDLNTDNFVERIAQIEDCSFIRITGQILFNDTKIIEDTLRNFNDFGYALGYVTTDENKKNQIKNLQNQVNEIKDRNQKAKAISLTNNINLKSHFKEQGLQLDDEFLINLSKVLHYGYLGQFEVQMPFFSDFKHILFSLMLNRNQLREDEHTLISKYGRESEKKFTVFGLVSQTNKQNNQNDRMTKVKEAMEGIEGSQMRAAILNVIMHITNLENTFSGKLEHEIVIDPIAIYREI